MAGGRLYSTVCLLFLMDALHPPLVRDKRQGDVSSVLPRSSCGALVSVENGGGEGWGKRCRRDGGWQKFDGFPCDCRWGTYGGGGGRQQQQQQRQQPGRVSGRQRVAAGGNSKDRRSN